MQRFREQIEMCNDCASACDSFLGHLNRSGSLQPPLLPLLVDAQQLCELAASCMSRQSEFLQKACALCADACQNCANACAVQDSRQLDDLARVCQDTAAALHLAAERVPRLGSSASGSAHERYAG